MIDKQKTFLFLLEQALIVSVLIDRKTEGVVLPEFVPGDFVVLDFGVNLPKPIFDLLVDDDGISATLSFSNAPFKVTIPWPSVRQLVVYNECQFAWLDEASKTAIVSDKVASITKDRHGLRSI